VSGHRTEDQSATIALLRDGAAYGHPADRVEIVETPAAIIFLAGEFAYKLKRAVRYPYLDFSTADKRLAALRRELEINGASAPGTYLEVLPIVNCAVGLAIGDLALGGVAHGDNGEPIDWVLKMARFDSNEELDRIAGRGEFNGELARDLGRAVAAAHKAASVRAEFDFAASLEQIITDNQTSLREDPDLFPADRAGALTKTALAMLGDRRADLAARRAIGLVRRCHGDLHLKNIVRINGRPVLFDALEVDEDLATTDLVYDLAYLLMDLWFEDLPWAANRVFNGYCAVTPAAWRTGELRLMPLMLATRAVIRAKVDAATAHQEADPVRRHDREEAAQYFEFAQRLLAPAPPRLVAVGGLSGTGKTTLAREIAHQIGPVPGAVHLRSDVIRKALFHRAPEQPLPQYAYHPAVTKMVFDEICTQAEAALAQGHGVIADAVFAQQWEREAIMAVGARAGVPSDGLWLESDLSHRLERVAGRRDDASDADVEVAARQETYATGTLSWHRINVSGALEGTVDRALSALARNG
jgi:aminoglycoside phosphotransferase family enzyme/predicted kinase